jgi:hypothetical protein
MTWIEITEPEYIEALEVLPSALRLDYGFLLDEPAIHKDGRPCSRKTGARTTRTATRPQFGHALL